VEPQKHVARRAQAEHVVGPSPSCGTRQERLRISPWTMPGHPTADLGRKHVGRDEGFDVFN
jgi:hypothetical protein